MKKCVICGKVLKEDEGRRIGGDYDHDIPRRFWGRYVCGLKCYRELLNAKSTEFEDIQVEQLRELIDDESFISAFLENCHRMKEETGDPDDSFAITKLALIQTVLTCYSPTPQSSYYKLFKKIIKSA